ncbi:hypothetical protein ANSO36C_04050 [Nostoc cf. commune SO-36]|uniref:Plasmid stabilization system protein n=1 Tax=Nostoc cf. commune SO-36 TaxID=449208 RepID=A0ABM7YVE2_NOSCO|nr:type II toxin-antitoxin system RelE/ParE family toxin [Nostoc commune]BDI14603.1 hypothetical protein ANSO36C_04050 [Nostoc cf. commune SO-36]
MTNPKLYILSPQAENDLAGIYAYIARDNLDAAEQMLDKLLCACELLTDNPRIGKYQLRPDSASRPFLVGAAPIFSDIPR